MNSKSTLLLVNESYTCGDFNSKYIFVSTMTLKHRTNIMSHANEKKFLILIQKVILDDITNLK